MDMIDSAKLYVKAGIDLKKVNLGLAWYGRSYKLKDPDCKGYGCDMSGGGAKGKCTGESKTRFVDFTSKKCSDCVFRWRAGWF